MNLLGVLRSLGFGGRWWFECPAAPLSAHVRHFGIFVCLVSWNLLWTCGMSARSAETLAVASKAKTVANNVHPTPATDPFDSKLTEKPQKRMPAGLLGLGAF